MFHVPHLERLRALVKAAIERGDMQMAWHLVGIIVLLPKEYRDGKA